MNEKSSPDTGPEHIKKILEDVFKDSGLESQVRAHSALIFWKRVAGEEIYARAKAAYLERGTLFVAVESSVWIHRLQLQETDLRKRMNRELAKEAPGVDPIKQIRFRLSNESN